MLLLSVAGVTSSVIAPTLSSTCCYCLCCALLLIIIRIQWLEWQNDLVFVVVVAATAGVATSIVVTTTDIFQVPNRFTPTPTPSNQNTVVHLIMWYSII